MSIFHIFLSPFAGRSGLERAREAGSIPLLVAGLLWLCLGMAATGVGAILTPPGEEAVVAAMWYPVTVFVILAILMVLMQLLFAENAKALPKVVFSAGLVTGVFSIGLGIGIALLPLISQADAYVSLPSFFAIGALMTSAIMIYAATNHLLGWRSGLSLWLGGLVLLLVLCVALVVHNMLFSAYIPTWEDTALF